MKTPSQIPRPTGQSVPPKFKEFLDFDFLPFYMRASLKTINIFESAVVPQGVVLQGVFLTRPPPEIPGIVTLQTLGGL